MPKYYTYRDDVPLGPGDTLAFAAGKGYYAKHNDNAGGGSTAASGSGADDAKQAAAAGRAATAASGGGGGGSSVAASVGAGAANVGDSAPAPQKPAGSASTQADDTAIDWQSMLGLYGLPDNLVADLNRIFQTTPDLNQAVTLAQAYVRGTEWYANTFPGIQQGINAGLFSDERGYRAYQNQLNQLYQQYYGRGVTSAEMGQTVKTGKSIDMVSRGFQSAAARGNLSDPLRALFSSDELKALTDEQAGIDTALGQRISAEADLAMRVNGLYNDFYGRAVTRDELNQLWKDGATAEDIAKRFATQENINAMNPAISHLFTADEIRQIALDAAGGITQDGKKLKDLADLAMQLNSVYHTYTGQGVTRDEVMAAYSNGLTADEVQRRLEAGTISGSLPDYLKQIFGEADVNLVGQEIAGASSSAEGKRLQNLMQVAPGFNQVFQQYQGRNITKDELAALVDQGTTADVVAKKFAGEAFVNANRNDIQYTSGAFGDSQLTEAQLAALGQEQAGYDTPLGQQVLLAYNKAQQRLHAAFRGVLASPALSLQNGRLSGPRKNPDIGA